MRESIGNFFRNFPFIPISLSLLTGGIVGAVMSECFASAWASIIIGAITAILMLIYWVFRWKDGGHRDN